MLNHHYCGEEMILRSFPTTIGSAVGFLSSTHRRHMCTSRNSFSSLSRSLFQNKSTRRTFIKKEDEEVLKIHRNFSLAFTKPIMPRRGRKNSSTIIEAYERSLQCLWWTFVAGEISLHRVREETQDKQLQT